MNDGIGKQGMNQYRDSVSTWRIYLPIDVDREKYVRTCFLTGTVSLVNENSEFKHRVKIGRLALQLIDFPKDEKHYGSEVICLTIPYSGELRVVDVFTSSSEFNDQEENQYRLYKNNGAGGYAEMRIDGDGKILLTVDGEDVTEVCVSVTNKDRSGSLKVNVNGEIMIINDGTTLVQSSKDVTIEQFDGSGDKTSINIIKDQVKITSKKIILNDSDEPILLGNKTTDLIGNILDILGSESAGPYPLLHNSKYIELKEKLNSLKSTISFVK